MNSEELKKLREEFENLKSTPSILDIDESTLNEFRIKGDGNIFKRFMDAINRDKITPSNEKIKEKENLKINNNKEKENLKINDNKEKENLKINNNKEKENIKINNKEKENKVNNEKEKENKVNNEKEKENKVNTNKNELNLKDMNKYKRDPNLITMKDFESKPPKVEPKISPATFKTNQNQSRDLVKTGKLKDSDLNKYSRSSSYTADDGKTQVNRSTVNTIAQFDMGPNIKKGDKLGVISGNMRKKYDMKAASFKPEAYDLVLDYVLSEGHADTVEEAHYVMTQMDEETIKSILDLSEGPIATAAAVTGALTLGGMGINTIRKMMNNKKKMDQGGQFKKGSTMDNIQKKNNMLKNM